MSGRFHWNGRSAGRPALGMPWRRIALALAAAVAAALASSGAARSEPPLPIVDAHSQVDHKVELAQVIALMDKGGVARTILAARGRLAPERLLAFAAEHPGRIVPAIRTKGKAYAQNKPGYYRLLKQQRELEGFQALAEVILWHAQKGSRAPQWVIPLDAPQVRAALELALERQWPFIPHIEFAEAGADAGPFMKKLEALLAAHPGHPFVLIHMGQLPAAEVERLIAAHPNVFFLTSHANPVPVKAGLKVGVHWVNLFHGQRLAADWKRLIVAHPDRFVLGFDNVFAPHWGPPYLKQIALWRKGLGGLPPDVAHALAYRNAERLWRLPPLP